MENIFGIHTLPNGRKYKLIDCGEYVGGEYPTGGIKILAWDNRTKNRENPKELGDWLYIDNSPNEECAREFLKSAARLPKLENAITEKSNELMDKFSEVYKKLS